MERHLETTAPRALSVVVIADRIHPGQRGPDSTLQELVGKPLLNHVLDGVATLSALLTRDNETLRLAAADVHVLATPATTAAWAERTLEGASWQPVEGHGDLATALREVLAEIPASHQVLVLYGDQPLVRPASLDKLLAAHTGGGLGVLVTRTTPDQEDMYLVRHLGLARGRITGYCPASSESPGEQEVLSGIVTAGCGDLRRWLEPSTPVLNVIERALDESAEITAVATRFAMESYSGAPLWACLERMEGYYRDIAKKVNELREIQAVYNLPHQEY